MKVYQKTTFSSRMKSRSYLSQLAFYPKRGGRSFEKFGPGPAPISRFLEGELKLLFKDIILNIYY